MKKYRSNIHSPYFMKLYLLVSFGALVLMFGLEKPGSGQINANIIISLLFPVGIYMFLWAVALLMPITVKPSCIKCYDQNGLYKELEWNKMETVSMRKVFGLPYAFISSDVLSYPITLPLYLNDMREFKERIYKYAGPKNPLSEFLKNET